jgi:hypothetical protein
LLSLAPDLLVDCPLLYSGIYLRQENVYIYIYVYVNWFEYPLVEQLLCRR